MKLFKNLQPGDTLYIMFLGNNEWVVTSKIVSQHNIFSFMYYDDLYVKFSMPRSSYSIRRIKIKENFHIYIATDPTQFIYIISNKKYNGNKALNQIYKYKDNLGLEIDKTGTSNMGPQSAK